MNQTTPVVAPDVIAIDAINRLEASDFIVTLADVYEHSPWVAERAAPLRPFASLDALAGAMQTIVRDAGAAFQLALLRAHPELGQGGRLSDHSTTEQRFAGFDRLTPDLAERLADLNRRYRTQFGFPFIIAVRGQKDTRAIIEQIERRMTHDTETEITIALDEVGRIARFRLSQLAGPEH